MKKLMVVLGGGGHTEQMLRVVDQLGESFNYVYLITEDDKVSEHKIKITGKIYRVKKAVRPYSYFFDKLYTLPANFFQSLYVYLKERPNAIVSAGPGTAILISFIGKLFGSKIIFIESWSRVRSFSSSGRIIYKFADLFFVQWEDMKELYPKAVYAGRLA